MIYFSNRIISRNIIFTFTVCRVACLRFLTYAYNETEKTVIDYYLLKN